MSMRVPVPAADHVRAAAAVLASLSLAVSAFAAHALAGDAQRRLLFAMALAMLHAPALLTLAAIDDPWVRRLAAVLTLGVVLFSGSLTYAAAGFGAPWLAPYSGSLLILTWLALGLRFVLRSRCT